MPGSYLGRFAPSPTGPLHIGSLIAAVASYLDARSQQGQWLLRMEDLDPPRESPGAARAIIDSLQAHGLHWDEAMFWQSQRHSAYQQAIEQLLAEGKAYYCSCSRAEIKQMGGIYDGRCRGQQQPPDAPAAIRLQVDNRAIRFDDSIQGEIVQQLDHEVGDFVIKRKDQLFAYQLAVVVDDAAQGISHVLRGSDLLDSTPRQIFLQQQLGLVTPRYSHIPVISNQQGQKLSKQTHAPALDNQQASHNLRLALHFLQQPEPPPALQLPAEILAWACQHWRPQAIPRRQQVEQTVLDTCQLR